MKKAFLLAALAMMAAVSANAQDFSKGDRFVGEQNGFGAAVNAGTTAKNLDFNLVGGWFLSDKFALDLFAGYSRLWVDEFEFEAPGKSGEMNAPRFNMRNNFNFGAGVRYYPVAGLFARVGYSARTSAGFLSYLDAKVGYDFFLSKNLFIEPAVYYQRNLNKPIPSEAKAELAGANILGASLGIGLRF